MLKSCWNCGKPVPLAQSANSSSTSPGATEELPDSLNQYLATNDVPLDSDIPLIRQSIADNQDRLDALNVQIDVLRTQLKQLILTRDETAETTRKYLSIASAARRVPPELLSDIASKAICTDIDRFPKMHHSPWNISQVCRAWRQSTLANPLLWGFIKIYHDRNIPSHESIITGQLLRSKNVPIDIVILWNDNFSCPRLFRLLLPHSHRWASFRLFCDGRNTFFEHLHALKGQLPLLQTLHLPMGPYGFLKDLVTESEVFSIAPSLREVLLLDDEYSGHHSYPLVIPWGQITRYRGLYGAKRQLEILQAAPNLVECGLAFDWTTPEGDEGISPSDMSLLPHLRRLFLQDLGFSTHINAPSLQELFSHGPGNLLLAFVSRSSCRLRKLVLGFRSGDATLIPALGALSSLEYLHLHGFDSGESQRLFDAMCVSGGASGVCPHLTSLAYGAANFSTFPYESFFAMVQSRLSSTSTTRLSFLRVYGSNPSPFQRQIESHIQSLRNGGMDAVFLRGTAATALKSESRP
ncbi:hypothetical protein C8R43DRAFT_444668 [Mycena crocata]|nr:hypothetical protein C8R43DRAFT_444668 [Mycena crocata]